MRLPGTLAKLYEDLAKAPAPISRVTVPTKYGPFVLEFAAALGAARPLASVPADSNPLPPRHEPAKKVRDLEILRKQTADPPHFVYEGVADAAG